MSFPSFVEVDKPSYQLPDTLAAWPWPRQLNVFYLEEKAASDAWVTKFGAFGLEAQQAFDRCNFSLLASLAYPFADAKQLRAACDMMQLCWVFDEYSDRENEDSIRRMAVSIMLGVRTPQVQQNSILGEIARQFGERAMPVLSSRNRHRFIESFHDYTDAIVQRAHDRDHAFIRDVPEYFRVRRETIGTRPAFAFLQFDMQLPDEVLEHPTLVRLQALASDMIILGNDLYSYNKEQASGADGHNVITIVRNQYGWSLDRALQWLAEQHERLVRDFMAAKAALPSFGASYDEQVFLFVDGVARWVRANEAWSFESGRYFGASGLDVQKHRSVVLLPRSCA